MFSMICWKDDCNGITSCSQAAAIFSMISITSFSWSRCFSMLKTKTYTKTMKPLLQIVLHGRVQNHENPIYTLRISDPKQPLRLLFYPYALVLWRVNTWKYQKSRSITWPTFIPGFYEKPYPISHGESINKDWRMLELKDIPGLTDLKCPKVGDSIQVEFYCDSWLEIPKHVW